MGKMVFTLAVLAMLIVLPKPLQAEEAVTPAWGTAERKAVLDAMREDIWNRFGLDVVFVVRWMKVNDGWCLALTEPQSEDGSERYEPYGALLGKERDLWMVREIMPLEEEAGQESWFSLMKEKYPGLPEDIFPGTGDR